MWSLILVLACGLEVAPADDPPLADPPVADPPVADPPVADPRGERGPKVGCLEILLAARAPIDVADPSCRALGRGSIGEVARAIRAHGDVEEVQREGRTCSVILRDTGSQSATHWTFAVEAKALVPSSLRCLAAG